MRGLRVTQLIYVAAKLNIADQLKDGPQTAEALASSVGAHPGSLYRVLRALASMDIFSENQHSQFELTPLAETLLSDSPDSSRDSAVMWGEELYWRPYGELLYAVKTGNTPFDHVFNMGFWDYLAVNPEASDVFNNAMTNRSGRDQAPVLAAYDFSGVSQIVDVGGGHGLLIAAILQAYPQMHGVVFDQP